MCFVYRLVLELYRRGFEDKDGDLSDQPVTALTACEGSFSFVLVTHSRRTHHAMNLEWRLARSWPLSV